MRRFHDGQSVFQADGQWLFHHDVDAMARADFDHAAMIVRVCVGEHSLRVLLGEHTFEFGEELSALEAIFLGSLREKLLIGLGDANDLDLGAVAGLFEESMHVAMNQADDADAQRAFVWAACACANELPLNITIENKAEVTMRNIGSILRERLAQHGKWRRCGKLRSQCKLSLWPINHLVNTL